MENNDLPRIHHCQKLTEIPVGREFFVYAPSLQLKSAGNPVHQVVRAALSEHCGKGRTMPTEVWVFGGKVYMPQGDENAHHQK